MRASLRLLWTDGLPIVACLLFAAFAHHYKPPSGPDTAVVAAMTLLPSALLVSVAALRRLELALREPAFRRGLNLVVLLIELVLFLPVVAIICVIVWLILARVFA